MLHRSNVAARAVDPEPDRLARLCKNRPRRYNDYVAGFSDAVSVNGDGNRVRSGAFDCA
jgi:hypothetical protein